MDWFSLTLAAAFFLGVYDIAKKHSVDKNAVPAVLFLNVLTGALIWCGPVLVAILLPAIADANRLSFDLSELAVTDGATHGLLACKSLLVGSSWICAFFALKHLPISTAATIRATSPLWTILLAVFWWGETLEVVQWTGVILILVSFFWYSAASRLEGVDFRKNRWVYLMIAATLISSFSGIYDKYLLQTCELSPHVVQAWFAIYLVPVMTPLLIWWLGRKEKASFQWRWSIPLIAIFLLLADFIYFTALTCPGALIALISPLRRTSLLIPFMFGIFFLAEQQWRKKMLGVLGILLGAFLLAF